MGKRETANAIREDLGGKRWTEREGRQALAAWKESGLSGGAFARRHGLNPQRLFWWRKQLGDWTAAEAKKKRTISTSIVSLIPAEVRTGTTSAAMALRLPGGVVVEFADVSAVSPSWIASLVSEVWRQS